MMHVLSLGLFLVAASLRVAAAETLPVFDGHIHFNADARAAMSEEAALRILSSAGISRALVSSTPNDGTHALLALAPHRIVAELRPYRSDADRGRWFDDPEVLSFVGQELRRGVYRAIGEFHVFGRQAQSSVMKQIVTLAANNGLPLHAHSDAQAVEIMFQHDERAQILWAHAGMSASVEEVARLLDRHSGLWVELSYRSDIAPNGRLDTSWRALFLRHPGRFILGSDTWTVSRWRDVPELTDAARAWIAQLPSDVAENIAWRNAQQLFPAQ